GLVLEQRWSTLLPFVPVLRGGQEPSLVVRALAMLRADERLAEMEPLLAFFATFVLTPDEVVKLMRWDMVMLRESPWYLEIEQEALQRGMQKGLEQGLQQGQAALVVQALSRRFGGVPEELAARVRSAPLSAMSALLDAVLSAQTLEEAAIGVDKALAQAGNGAS
ncbi:MAG: DUF4351 domain-containing protein, partial [Caldilineales bacterium]|nr:DUF4351 domain-containing protein [Caldilineales bacterium]